VPGVVVHAQAINTMLTGTFLVPESSTSAVARIAAVTLLVALVVLFLPLWAAPIGVVAFAGTYLVAAFAQFDAGTVPFLVHPMAAVLVASVAALAARHWLGARQQRQVEMLFARYVPPDVARQLVDEGRPVAPGAGERVEVTVCFCDIRGFTSLCERLEPTQLRSMLDEYYGCLVEIIHAHGGTVLNFVGDEIVAAWGVPLADPLHRRRALEGALAMQAARPALVTALAEHGVEPIDFGIGLSDGDAVAGHVGRGPRLQYTVLGETVNIGARLCSAAGPGEIVCTRRILDALEGAPAAVPIDDVSLKGVSRELALVRIEAQLTSIPPSHVITSPTV
jgi:adenylate cyclase